MGGGGFLPCLLSVHVALSHWGWVGVNNLQPPSPLLPPPTAPMLPTSNGYGHLQNLNQKSCLHWKKSYIVPDCEYMVCRQNWSCLKDSGRSSAVQYLGGGLNWAASLPSEAASTEAYCHFPTPPSDPAIHSSKHHCMFLCQDQSIHPYRCSCWIV